MTTPEKITLSYTERVEYTRSDLVKPEGYKITSDNHGLYLHIKTPSGSEATINLLTLHPVLYSEQAAILKEYHQSLRSKV